ncbi:hypothetical protein GE061_017947 [Apolygus lucorum]|uniref:HYDIN/VesB/CFA65-like Ig-like domain-containing protein n=1 Tax=Apolygus lucorum TaxID=248454 RepID=A0A8S9XEJ0_APOLU|nr:hypothetical protein GE061_017947 [Apolygus lucorum]
MRNCCNSKSAECDSIAENSVLTLGLKAGNVYWSSQKHKKSHKARRSTVVPELEPISQPNEEFIAIVQKEVTNTLLPILSKAEEIGALEDVNKITRYLKSPLPLDRFNEFFLISPMRGQVSPGETLTFSIAYLPREPRLTVEGEVRVYRDGDYQETLKLKGSCRQSFQYEITPLNVNLGIIPFCEITTSDVYISNLTECPMEIEVLNIMEEDAKDKRFQKFGTNCVKPKKTTVNAYSTEVLTVFVHPLVLSGFTKKYRIKIHGIQDETLTVQGESSLHFLNLGIPPSFDQIPILEQYNGLRIMFNKYRKPEEELAKSQSNTCLLSPPDEFDWEMMFLEEIPEPPKFNDGILMGIAENTSKMYCEEYYQHAKSNTRTDPLPHLVLPKQVFDLGGTVIEEHKKRSLRLYNNSDFDVHYSMKVNKSKTQLQTMGMKIEGLDGTHFIRKGGVNNHAVVFHPRDLSYNLKKKLQIKMGWLLSIEVACGPVMMVHIKALVTKPFVTVPSAVDFGHVRCNEKVFVKLKITNENVTRCEWSLEMKRSFYETAKRKILRVGVPNPFAIEGPDMNGILGPMSEYELLISFEPRSTGEFIGEFKTDVDNKRLSYITELRGFGVGPNVEFLPPKIEFEGIVPHKGYSEKVLMIRNKGMDPVDLYLPECRDYFMQQFMVRSVLNYMQREACYVPACREDDTPMSYLHEMFAILLQKAEEHFAGKGAILMDEYDTVNEYLNDLEEEPETPRVDLASIICARAEERQKEIEFGNGRLIICTGAPTVDYIQEANLMAAAMKLNVASLDQIFFEELSTKNSELATEVQMMIDNEFHKIIDNDFNISPELASNDNFKPILWRMKVEAINRWTDWLNLKNLKPEPKVPENHLSTQSPKTPKTKSKIKVQSSADKDEMGQPENPFLRIQPQVIQLLIQDRFQELIHKNGLIIDRLTSSILRDPSGVFRLFTLMTSEHDRVDFVDMFTTHENIKERNRLREETEKQKQESLIPRFSQICLYDETAFDALDETLINGFFEELQRRYILCHRAELVESPQKSPEKSGKKKSKAKRKSKTGNKRRSMSQGGRQNRPSKKSFRSLRSAPSSIHGSEGELSKQNQENMKMMKDFAEYESLRVDVNYFLQGKKRSSSKAGLNPISPVVNYEKRVNVWIINSQPYQVESRHHELLKSLLACDEFKTPEKIQELNPSSSLERYFRLDRPRFINEIDGNVDGLWFPSLTHTFGVYSAEPENPFCIYPIDPANIFCGISRLGFRRSNWWPDEQTVSIFHLEPDEKISALVIFQPKETGSFEKELRVNIADWPGQATGIVIEGVSDIPHIDLSLETLFPPNCYALEELTSHSSLSVAQETTLEMGPALISKAKGDKKYQVKSYLILKNISKVKCDMLFSLKSPSTTFELEIDQASIKPNESVQLNISAFPWLPGFRSCIIVISIEDNPIPIFIEARVEGYDLRVLVSPKVVKMEHVLISQTEKAYFKIMNDTWVPIRWKLNERHVWNYPYLKFKTRCGVLNPQETIVSIVSYSPLIQHEMNINIDVMIRHNLDTNSKYEKGATLKLKVSSRDLVIDVAMPTSDKGNRTLIFDDTYVDTPQSKSFIISNLSGFPMKFEIACNTHLSINVHDVLTISPTEGIISKHKEQIVEITAKSSKPVAFKSLPLLLIEIWDVATNVHITEIAINVNYKVFYPNYEIRPQEDLSFGSVTVANFKVIDFVIENKGTLPLEYSILTELIPPTIEEPTDVKPEKHHDVHHDMHHEKHHARKGKKKKHSTPSLIHEPEKLPRINLTGMHAHKPDTDHHKKGKKGRGKHSKQKHKKKPTSAPAEALKKTESSLKRATTVVSEGVVATVKPRITHMKRSTMLRRSLMRARKGHKKSRSVGTLTKKVSTGKYEMIWEALKGSRRDLLGHNTNKVAAGPFIWENPANKVNPKETANLRLTFNPQQEGEFTQTFFCDIPYAQHGTHEINVSGNGVLPSISHTLVEVLRDALINLNPEKERQILEQGFPCNTYHEEVHYLELCNYIVGESTPIKFFLLNDGPVSALVHIYFTGDTTESFKFQGDLTRLDVSIPQKTCKPVELWFTPKSTEPIEVLGHLELMMPRGIENRHYIVHMRGKGNIPLVIITKPEDFEQSENKYFMDMGISILNSSTTDYFSFKNIGTVVARVLVEFPITPGIFSFKARGNYRDLLKHPSNDPLIDPFAITMSPGMEIDITVEYIAASKVLDTCNVYIHVIGNPYEKLVLEIYGKGIDKELNMDLPTGCEKDIETKKYRRKAISAGGKADNVLEQGRASKERFYYVLDFGCVGLNEFSKITFTMNNSSYLTVRVSFDQNKFVWFIPHTFHIGPHCSKEIIALFRSSENVFHEATLEVNFEPIAHVNLRSEAWDVNPKLFQTILNKEGNEIRLEDLAEPEIEEPPFESQSGKLMEHKHLEVAVHGLAGNSDLTMVVDSIEFPPTRSNEESTAILFVRNSGNRIGECYFELRDLVKEDWGNKFMPKCSIGLETGSIHRPLETEPTYLINLRRPEGYPSLKPERLGYLYAPTTVKLNDATNVENDESTTVHSASSETNADCNPFRIEPKKLLVPPGEVQYVKVSFIPGENCSTTCTLIATFEDPDGNQKGYCSLLGTTLFCPCHIVCQPGKPDFDHFGCEDIKVIDVRATSLQADARKQFDLLNVSKETFEYYFKKLGDTDNKTMYCNPVKGTVGPSKKKKIVLHFHPTTLEDVKSMWSLNIPLFNVEQKILFCGRVTSPAVKIIPAAVTVPTSLIGIFCTNTFEIASHDETDFEFSLRPLPLPVGNLECYITPDRGTVSAGGSVPFKVRYTSQSSGNLTIQIACELKNHKVEIIALIFVEFFELQCMFSLLYDRDQKRKLDPSRTNEVNIGFMEPNHPHSASFILANFGKGPLRFRWHVVHTQEEKRGVCVNYDRTSGVLERQTTQTLQIVFTLSKNSEFKNYIVELQVYRGPTYTLSFSGHSELPYKFSFKTFNFGNCPVLQTGVCNYIKTLNFTNEGDHPIELENTFSNKPHLLVLWSCGSVQPKETVSIMVEFYPVSHAFYQEEVIFNINGITSETITFLGKGLTIAVRLSDPHKDTVDLKNVQVGSTRTEIKKVVNHSPLPVGCELEMENCEDLKVSPSTFVIKKNGIQDLYISYSPKSKTQPFFSEVFLNAGGIRNFLFTVKCSSSHISVRLENKVCLFGRAVKYCPVQFSVNIINDGDIGVDYYWNLDKLKPLLTVTPERGYITPNSTILSTFRLLSLKKFTINQKVNLVYNGNQIEDLKIVGEFTEIPDPSETINFKTLVRSSVKHTVELESRAVEPAILFPVLIGEYFSGADFIEVLPLQNGRYTVTYAPLSMTMTAVHSGRLFVPYPDGTCVYYALIGEALPPQPEEIIHWTVLSKMSVTQTFEVSNWLNEFQRLSTNINLDNSDNIQTGIVSIMGEPTVCLQPNGSISYPVDVMVCKAINFSFKIFFVNPETKEYRFYVVHVKSISPSDTLFSEIHACIHDSASTVVKLSNPFVEPVTFKFHSPVPELTAEDVTVQPHSEADMEVEYSPGAIEPPKEVSCHVTGPPLDQEFFTFYLVSLPSLTAPAIKVSASMGSSTEFSIDVNNPGKHKVAYTVKVQGGDISVLNGTDFEIPSQKTHPIVLNYEPSEVGDKEHRVEIISSIGESSKRYIWATCYLPKPMGPININVGTYETLQFKNVLEESATFSLTTSEFIFAIDLQKADESITTLPGLFKLERKETALIFIELRGADVQEHRPINTFPSRIN